MWLDSRLLRGTQQHIFVDLQSGDAETSDSPLKAKYIASVYALAYFGEKF